MCHGIYSDVRLNKLHILLRLLSNSIQIITLVISMFISFSFIDFNIPGHGNFCDADQLYIAYLGIILISCCLAFLGLSIYSIIKKRLIKIRYTGIALLFLLVVGIFTSNKIGQIILFSGGSAKIKAKLDYPIIDLTLYESGDFYVRTYDTSCNDEIIGTYQLNNDTLVLIKENESHYLSKSYIMSSDSLISIPENKYNLKRIKK